MHHGPAVELGVDLASKKKARLGVWFFFLYFIFYAGFVAIGVFNYELLSIKVFGQNLAIVYGIGLIVFAVVLGLIYNAICTRYEDQLNKEEKA
ncbi:MAG: DUF485 domain-containing protein [Flavobacteriaceae bacterium]|nr:DUF485 domain-containing protein [Flavobacteriaceae bacterium]